jgi:predicted Zn-dependent protease
LPLLPLLLVVSLPGLLLPTGAGARSLPLIRDAEIETIIRVYAAPLFEAAQLDPRAVEVVVVNDPSLNAFVAGGQRIFLNTGLLLAAETPNQLIGVIAHEAGHIAGGHLTRIQDELFKANIESIVALILGGAAAAAGQGQAAGAIMAGGAALAQGSLLQYSRAQESVADQAALRALDATGQSARGLMNFLIKLGDQELLSSASQDPYVRTHPLSQERVEAIRAKLRTSQFADIKDSPALLATHARMRAKLFGYLKGLTQTLREYPESDVSVPARYARAIAYHLARQTDKAIETVRELIAEAPRDPYYEELLGQILLESQRVDEAIPAYARAVTLKPDSALLRIGLGQAQVSAESNAHIGAAIDNLRRATELEPGNAGAWRFLATAYARDGQEAMAALATAERYAIRGEYRDAQFMAARAKKGLAKGTPSYLRAEDLESLARQMIAKREQ